MFWLQDKLGHRDLKSIRLESFIDMEGVISIPEGKHFLDDISPIAADWILEASSVVEVEVWVVKPTHLGEVVAPLNDGLDGVANDIVVSSVLPCPGELHHYGRVSFDLSNTDLQRDLLCRGPSSGPSPKAFPPFFEKCDIIGTVIGWKTSVPTRPSGSESMALDLVTSMKMSTIRSCISASVPYVAVVKWWRQPALTLLPTFVEKVLTLDIDMVSLIGLSPSMSAKWVLKISGYSTDWSQERMTWAMNLSLE